MSGCVRRLIFAPSLAYATLLVACGGGGGNLGPPPPTMSPSTAPPSTPPTAPPSTGPGTTTASGVLVDDADGSPLPNVPVALAPWTAGATPIPETTTAPDGTFAFTAANGHYLLVIGNNVVADTTAATIHDNVMLTGGTQMLKAPVLPMFPTIAVPLWETNGDYRIAKLNAQTEVPCIQAFEAFRTTNNVPQVVVDEWLIENVRGIRAWAVAGFPKPSPPNGGGITSFGDGSGGGAPGSTCSIILSPGLALTPQSKDARVIWYGGFYSSMTGGAEEYPFDPRVYVDPVGLWP